MKYSFGALFTVLLFCAASAGAGWGIGRAQGQAEGFAEGIDMVMLGDPFSTKFDYVETFIGYTDLSSLIDGLGEAFGGLWAIESDSYLIDGVSEEAALLSSEDTPFSVVAYKGYDGWNGILFSRSMPLGTVPLGAELVEQIGAASFYEVDSGLIVAVPSDEYDETVVLGIITDDSWHLRR
jgi:hypothetical protein